MFYSVVGFKDADCSGGSWRVEKAGLSPNIYVTG
jgi:hypothetical protein